MDSIGDRVKEIRNRYGLNQEEFADALNTYRVRISRIENGTVQPTFQEIIDICEKYNTSVDFFVTSKEISTQDFKKISERYIKNNQLLFEERRESIESIYLSLAQEHLKSIYNINDTKQNNYIKDNEKCNKISIEKIGIQ